MAQENHCAAPIGRTLHRYPNIAPYKGTITMPYPYCNIRVIPFTDLSREESAQVESLYHDAENDDDRVEVVPGWTVEETLAREG